MSPKSSSWNLNNEHCTSFIWFAYLQDRDGKGYKWAEKEGKLWEASVELDN